MKYIFSFFLVMPLFSIAMTPPPGFESALAIEPTPFIESAHNFSIASKKILKFNVAKFEEYTNELLEHGSTYTQLQKHFEQLNDSSFYEPEEKQLFLREQARVLLINPKALEETPVFIEATIENTIASYANMLLARDDRKNFQQFYLIAKNRWLTSISGDLSKRIWSTKISVIKNKNILHYYPDEKERSTSLSSIPEEKTVEL